MGACSSAAVSAQHCAIAAVVLASVAWDVQLIAEAEKLGFLVGSNLAIVDAELLHWRVCQSQLADKSVSVDKCFASSIHHFY